MKLDKIHLSRVEHAAWLRLCKLLHETGAATEADLRHSATSMETPGDRLFAAIRAWGDALAALKAEE
mgnify:FL=1